MFKVEDSYTVQSDTIIPATAAVGLYQNSVFICITLLSELEFNVAKRLRDQRAAGTLQSGSQLYRIVISQFSDE